MNADRAVGEGPRWRRVVGLLLVVAGCVGFRTVADDFRHVGELCGVGGILLAGLMLLAAEVDHVMTRGLALEWVALGIGVGLIVGAAIDNMPVGVGGGAALGAIWVALSRRRRG